MAVGNARRIERDRRYCRPTSPACIRRQLVDIAVADTSTLVGNAPQIATAVEGQVALGELAVGSRESHQRAQRTCGRILVNDPVARRAALLGGPKEVAVAVENDPALGGNAVCGNAITVEAHQRGQRAAAE